MSDEPPKYSAELYMASGDLLLVDGVQVNMGAATMIGLGNADPGYFISMEGRVNRTEERKVVHLFMDARFGFDFAGQLMERLEGFIAMAKKAADDPEDP